MSLRRRRDLRRPLFFAFAAVVGLLCRPAFAQPQEEPAGNEAAANEAAANEPAANEPAANEPAANEPAANEPAANEEAATSQAFTGSNRCFSCHRKQAAMWSETKHAKAYDVLPAKYRNDVSCLKCHVTAFGEPTGFVLGADAEKAEPFLAVGCETCHGPGALHEAAVAKWTLADPADEERLMEQVKATTVKVSSDQVCAKCHRTQAHERHPPYDGQPASHRLAQANASGWSHSSWSAKSWSGASWSAKSSGAAACWRPATSCDPCRGVASRQASGWASAGRAGAAHGGSGSYSVKSCGSCHYEKYQQWGAEKHAQLSASLPAKYASDNSCAECHPRSDGLVEYVAAHSGSGSGKQLRAACEACHGDGGEHVAFNKRTLTASLTRSLETAARQTIRKHKPAAACVQCHGEERHQPHPEFDRPSGQPPATASTRR